MAISVITWIAGIVTILSAVWAFWVHWHYRPRVFWDVTTASLLNNIPVRIGLDRHLSAAMGVTITNAGTNAAFKAQVETSERPGEFPSARNPDYFVVDDGPYLVMAPLAPSSSVQMSILPAQNGQLFPGASVCISWRMLPDEKRQHRQCFTLTADMAWVGSKVKRLANNDTAQNGEVSTKEAQPDG
ncbi:MAG: hypothetical protein FWF36_02415 [Propionibacteriaceae bacterium]|nr:hypothetical protein [Propionibacteriaceae bacterium]